MKKDVKLIKFTTGEEVVCEIVKTYGDVIEFKNGLTMVFNGQGIQAIPFSMNIEDNEVIVVNISQVQFQATPRKDLLDQYQQQFSGIITPPKSLIT